MRDRPARARAARRSALTLRALSQGGEVGPGVDVEQQRGGLLDAAGHPAARARSSWRRRCRDRSSGRSRPPGSTAGRWCRCRGGRARSPPRRRAGREPASSASSSSGSSAGQSPGTHRTRSKPSPRARCTPRATAADWPLSFASVTSRAPSSRASAAIARSRVTTIVRSIEGVLARASSTSPTIAGASSLRSSSTTLAPEALLGPGEALDGQDRGGAHLGADDSARPGRPGPRPTSRAASGRR